MIYDGANTWATDATLLKLNPDGSIAQSINVGASPGFPVFDGINIWVPDGAQNAVTVVRVKDAMGNPLANPFVLATLTGNGLNNPYATAFDGERILVTNMAGDGVSVWRAENLTPLGSYATGAGTAPRSASSDGLNFWIVFNMAGKLARF